MLFLERETGTQQMAPRGRTRKPGLTRMDAAIDQLVPYGFTRNQVRRTVNQLLKVYGGDDGWPFIEANAYILVIETILSNQEEEVQGDKSNGEEIMLLDEPLQVERAGDCSEAADAGPSSQILASTSSEVADAAAPISQVLALTCSEVVDAAAQTTETEVRDCLLSAKGNRRGLKDVRLDQNCNEDMVNAIDKGGKNDNDSRRGMQIDHSPLLRSPPPITLSPPSPANNLPPRRRKPCYGWISSSDEEDDFIVLTPAVRLPAAKQPGHSQNGKSGKDKHHRRMSGWDVRPESKYM
ncbi:unnamed protein product [Camellia sinensis]